MNRQLDNFKLAVRARWKAAFENTSQLAREIKVTRRTVLIWLDQSKDQLEHLKKLPNIANIRKVLEPFGMDASDLDVDQTQFSARLAPSNLHVVTRHLQTVFPTIVNRDYDDCLKGEYVCYALKLYQPDVIGVSECIIEAPADRSHLTFRHRFRDQTQPEDRRDWTASGIVTIAATNAFFVGSHQRLRNDPYMLLVSVGVKRNILAKVFHGIVLALDTEEARPGATRVSFYRKRAAEKYQIGNFPVGKFSKVILDPLLETGTAAQLIRWKS
jgi:hypothetical protein